MQNASYATTVHAHTINYLILCKESHEMPHIFISNQMLKVPLKLRPNGAIRSYYYYYYYYYYYNYYLNQLSLTQVNYNKPRT